MAGSRKGKRFWIWFGVGAAVVVLAAAGFGAAKLVSGASIDQNRIAKVARGDVARRNGVRTEQQIRAELERR